MRGRKLNSVERDLLKGFGEFARDLKRGDSLDEKYTCHRLEVDLRANDYGPEDVQAARRVLKASQAIFARFLGVSPKTVQGWESGKPVSALASRFMDEIRSDPKYWRERLNKSAKVKARRTDSTVKPARRAR
jgi:putative transcriptional regulator